MGLDERVTDQVSAHRDTGHDTSRAGGGIPAGTPYHRVLAQRTRGRGIWRAILAIVLLFGGLLGFGAIAAQISGQIDLLLGRDSIVTGGTEFTPVTLASTFASSALLIPWSMLIQRWLYGIKGRTMHSVTGVFRAAVLGRAVLILVPVWAIYMTVLTILQPSVMTDWAVGDLLFMFVVTIVIVPLQSAGEEYGFRGLIFRVAASWGRSPRSALVLGVVVSSVLFATIHLSTDLWLNLQFLAVGITFALITWRTGGLETSVVLHTANNSLGMMLALALHADLNATTDRSSGVGSAAFLIPVVLLAAITAVIWYRTRNTGPALTRRLDPAADPQRHLLPAPLRATGRTGRTRTARTRTAQRPTPKSDPIHERTTVTTETQPIPIQNQPVEVRNNSEESRFDILVGGVPAGFSMYTHYDEGPSRQRVFFHTVIDEKFDGRGLAGVLTRTALRTSVQEGYRIVAVCPYVARWLTTHRDVNDAVDRVRPAHLMAVRQAAQEQNGANT